MFHHVPVMEYTIVQHCLKEEGTVTAPDTYGKIRAFQFALVKTYTVHI